MADPHDLRPDCHPLEAEYRFCPLCGGSLARARLKPPEPPRLRCSACGFVFYLDPKVVACAIVERRGRIALLKRAIAPKKGKWVVPGGYVDRGEEVPQAAVRETLEECGLRIRIERLLGVYSYPGIIPVVIVYQAAGASGRLVAGDETAEAAWFARDEIPWHALAFPSTTDALRDYLGARGEVPPEAGKQTSRVKMPRKEEVP